MGWLWQKSIDKPDLKNGYEILAKQPKVRARISTGAYSRIRLLWQAGTGCDCHYLAQVKFSKKEALAMVRQWIWGMVMGVGKRRAGL
ncbi:hypothetical protein KCP73_09860 [Salmonella enterica subsp. enterica]|nr:hypothetical protein KCP73_09860 [Salmonella enterica subsp. enterica]